MSKVLISKHDQALNHVKNKIVNEKFDKWSNSKHKWVRELQSGSKGRVGELFIEEWFSLEGIKVQPSRNGEGDRFISGLEIEIKLSTLWERGVLCFQQIRDQKYDLVFFIGILPDKVYFWSVPKDIAIKYSVPQHSGKDGNDTKWLLVDCNNIPDWLSSYGGSLDVGLEVYKKQITKLNICK
jgi:hypothetical protein